MQIETEESTVFAKNNYSFPIKIKHFFILIIIALLFWTLISNDYQRAYSIKSLKDSFKDINFMQFLENIYPFSNETLNETLAHHECIPILQNSKQYSVLIDGVQYPTQVPLHKNVSINFKCLDKSSTKKIILFYNTWFGNEAFSIGIGYRHPFSSSGCPVTSCETTNDKRRLNESDFVVTHMRDSIPQLPNYRSKNQRWIFLLYVIRLFKKFIFKKKLFHAKLKPLSFL